MISIASIARDGFIETLEKDLKLDRLVRKAPAWGEYTATRSYNGPLTNKYHAEDSAYYIYEASTNGYFKVGGVRYPAGAKMSIYGQYSSDDNVGWKAPCGGITGVNAYSTIDPTCSQVMSGLLGPSASKLRTARKDDVPQGH